MEDRIIRFFAITYEFILSWSVGESNPSVAVLRSSLSLIPTFRPLHPCHSCGLSRRHPRPPYCPTIQCGPSTIQCDVADYPVQQGFLLCPIFFYLRSDAATIAVHQSSHEVLHIDFRCCENDTIILVITKAHTVHYQNQCNLVLYALRLPLY